MTEQRQDDVCREICGLPPQTYIVIQNELRDGSKVDRWVNTVPTKPLFTRDDNMARLLRAKVIEAGVQYQFIRILRQSHKMWPIPMFEPAITDMMQATPAQQVEATLKALGKWEETGTE